MIDVVVLCIHGEDFLVLTTSQTLYRARALRGWSQAIVAGKVGTTSKNVSRWECGETFPSPYFRERLCQLFELDAETLGLLPSLTRAAVKETNICRAKQPPPIISSSRPFSGTQRLIGHESLLKDLRCQLKPGSILALTGLPGAGKTAVLGKLMQYTQVQKRFHDGIIWVRLGPNPDVPFCLAQVACKLGCSIAGEQGVSEADSLQALHEEFAVRRFIIVLDDVWTVESALPFILKSPSTSYIITTRIPQVAFALALRQTSTVPPLSSEASYELLTTLIPQIETINRPLLQKVIELTGGIPLALVLIGKYLASHSYKKRLQDVETALYQLIDSGYRLNLSSPLLRANTPHMHGEDSISLEETIALSYRHLPTNAQAALQALSVLPSVPERFSEEDALAITGAKQEVLDLLVDNGLLEPIENRYYQINRIIADYAWYRLQERVV